MRRTKTPAPQTLGGLRAGSVLGTYELLLSIAEGGTGIVWAARLVGPRRFQKLVAVKTIRRAYEGDPRFERMLRAEGAIASRAKHPNIAQIRELGETDSTLYLAMEWVHGEPLTTVEKQCAYGLPVALAARIVADAALGLHAVHSIETRSGERMGLVHCDISPHNLLLTTTGAVKVVDFGVARASHPSAISACPDGFVGGKPSFMAPEQAEGGAIDHRSDVFALGIVLYRLITGSHPFPGDTALERLKSMLKRSRLTVPPVSLRVQCTDALSVVVLRALEKDPARRFQSMSAFADALVDAVPAIEDATCRQELAAFARAAIGEAVADRSKAIAKAIRARQTRPISLPDDVLTELDRISYPDGVPVELERISVPFLPEPERPVSLPDDAFVELDGEDEAFAEEEAATLRRSTYRPVTWSEPPPDPAVFRRGRRSWLFPAMLVVSVLIGIGAFLPVNDRPAPAHRAASFVGSSRVVRAPDASAPGRADSWQYDPGF